MSDKKACYEKCMQENYTNPRKCDDSEGNCKEAAAKHCRQQCGGMDEDVKDFFKSRIYKVLQEKSVGIEHRYKVGYETPNEKKAKEKSTNIAASKSHGNPA